MQDSTTPSTAVGAPRSGHAWIARLLSAILLAAVAVTGIAGLARADVSPAQAQPATASISQQVQSPSVPQLCNPEDPNDGCYKPPIDTTNTCFDWVNQDQLDELSSSDLLANKRWGSAASDIHTRLDAKPIADITQKIQRNNIDSMALGIGNAAWGFSSSMVEMSSRFCITDSVAASVDTLAATVGGALIDSGVAVIALIAAVVFAAWRAARGRAVWGQLGRIVLVFGLMGGMMLGASNSNPEAGTFGKFSPGWMMTNVNNVISATTSLPLEGLLKAADSDVLQLKGDEQLRENNNLHCGRFIDGMNAKYKEQFASNTFLQAASATPLALDQMWQDVGLRAYTAAQFGTRNAYGNQVNCRQLEYNSGISAEDMAKDNKAFTGVGNGEVVPGSMVWSPASTTDEDRAVVFWASCRYQGGVWSVNSGWGGDRVNHTQGDKEHTPEACENAWAEGDLAGTVFDYQDNAADIQKGHFTTSGPGLDSRDFLLTYHGDNTGEASTSAFVYSVVAIFLAIVFGILAGVIIVAKAAMIPMILLLFVVMLADLLPGRTESKTAKYAKLYLGYAILAFGAAAILAGVVFLTRAMQFLGGLMADSLVAIVWAGAAPVIAILALKYLFTKVFKAPDPFSLSGAAAYATSAGAIGGSAGGPMFQGGSSSVDNRMGMFKRAGAHAIGGKMRDMMGGGSGSRYSGSGARRSGGVGQDEFDESSTQKLGGGNESGTTDGQKPADGAAGGTAGAVNGTGAGAGATAVTGSSQAGRKGGITADETDAPAGSVEAGRSSDGTGGAAGVSASTAASTAAGTVGGAAAVTGSKAAARNLGQRVNGENAVTDGPGDTEGTEEARKTARGIDPRENKQWKASGPGKARAQDQRLRDGHAEMRKSVGGFNEDTGGKLSRAAARVGNKGAVRATEAQDTVGAAWDRFREKPFRRSLAAMKGSGGVAATAGLVGAGLVPGLAAMPAAAAVAGVAGTIWGVRKLRQAMRAPGAMSAGHRRRVSERDVRAMAYYQKAQEDARNRDKKGDGTAQAPGAKPAEAPVNARGTNQVTEQVSGGGESTNTPGAATGQEGNTGQDVLAPFLPGGSGELTEEQVSAVRGNNAALNPTGPRSGETGTEGDGPDDESGPDDSGPTDGPAGGQGGAPVDGGPSTGGPTGGAVTESSQQTGPDSTGATSQVGGRTATGTTRPSSFLGDGAGQESSLLGGSDRNTGPSAPVAPADRAETFDGGDDDEASAQASPLETPDVPAPSQAIDKNQPEVPSQPGLQEPARDEDRTPEKTSGGATAFKPEKPTQVPTHKPDVKPDAKPEKDESEPVESMFGTAPHSGTGMSTSERSYMPTEKEEDQ